MESKSDVILRNEGLEAEELQLGLNSGNMGAPLSRSENRSMSLFIEGEMQFKPLLIMKLSTDGLNDIFREEMAFKVCDLRTSFSSLRRHTGHVNVKFQRMVLYILPFAEKVPNHGYAMASSKEKPERKERYSSLAHFSSRLSPRALTIPIDHVHVPRRFAEKISF